MPLPGRTDSDSLIEKPPAQNLARLYAGSEASTTTRCHRCARVLNYNPLRYRFADFILSPSRRTLLREGKEAPLIPRYFDLLVLLIEKRNEAVHRQEILDAVWKDVIVSDGALTQAIRTLRRTLGDDSKEPVFIRTVSRHGYRFVFANVVEEAQPYHFVAD